jgi:hypothetical protein
MVDTILKRFISIFLITAIILFLIHLVVTLIALEDTYTVGFWWLSYAYLVPITILGFYMVIGKYGKTGKISSVGKSYLLYTGIKMLGAIGLLLPWLLFKDDSSKPMVIHFFAVFLPFLFIETLLIVKLLNTSFEEKNKNEINQLEK